MIDPDMKKVRDVVDYEATFSAPWENQIEIAVWSVLSQAGYNAMKWWGDNGELRASSVPKVTLPMQVKGPWMERVAMFDGVEISDALVAEIGVKIARTMEEHLTGVDGKVRVDVCWTKSEGDYEVKLYIL